MGVVYLARHDAGHEAAVKVVHPHLIGDPGFRVRFAREIAVARSVDAPWTARVLDADPQGERPWLATEFVDGPALDEQVARAGGLPRAALEILGRRLAEALAALHAGGVVHRDLKPSNVLLGTDGPQLIDFGIARSVDATKITHTGLVMGTPAYMAPEQAEGDDAGPPADVFSLASVLWFAATGDGPFGTASHPAAMLLRILQRTPDTSTLPPPLDGWLRPCFAKDPTDRPTAAELATLWADAPANEETQRAATVRPGHDRAPRPLLYANAVLATLLVAVLGLVLFWVPTSSAAVADAMAPAPDGTRPQVTQVAEIPMGGPVDDVELSRDGRTLMVDTGEGGVRFVDTATRQVTPTVRLPDATSTLTLAPDGARAFLTGRGISVLDVRSGAVSGPIGTGDATRTVAIDPTGRIAYVAYRARFDLGIVDLADGREIGSVPIGRRSSQVALVGDGRLFVIGGIAETQGDNLGLVVDTATRTVVGRLPEYATAPVPIDGGARAAVLIGGGQVTIVDTRSGEPTGRPVRGFSDDTLSLAATPGGEALLGT